jgi:hypothetical protein
VNIDRRNEDRFSCKVKPAVLGAASLIVEGGLDHVAYTSPAGPITPLDMIFGHSESIARGRLAMAHKTGFTCASLGRRFVDAGFPVVLIKQDGLNLWALGLMQDADQASIQRNLVAAGLALSEHVD